MTATSSLAISNGVTVKTSVGAFGTVSNLGAGQSSIGVSSQVGTSVSVGNVESQGPVFLANSATVHGTVTTPGSVTEQQGAVITGGIVKQTVATDSTRKITVTFPTSAPSVTLQPGAAQTLLPGSYGAAIVNSHATVSLSTGTYLFTSVDLEPQSTLHLDESAGPVVIYIQNALLYKGNEVQVGGDGNVFVGMFGTQAVSLQAPFRGTLVASNAPLEFTTQSSGFAGAFWGSVLQVDPNSPITGLGAVLPSSTTTGVSPTLNCVVHLSSTQLGAVFGYRNTTGANVTLGAGPHNMFSPGPADLGQPILFVPGTVPIATFQTFAAGASLSYTIGQQSVVASASTPACPAATGTALSQLFFTEDANTQAIRAHAAAILASPNFASWISATQSNFAAQLTPFETSLLAAARLVAANADLLGEPSSLSTSQLARIPTFRASLLGNAAITQLRLNGDALRGTPGAIPCNVVGTIDAEQPRQTIPALAPQIGSLFAQVQAAAGLSAIQTVQATVAGIANGPQQGTLLAAPGLLLAAFQPESALIGIQLSGAIPTGILSAIGGAITGAIVGGVTGFFVGGPEGALVGAVSGAVIGAIACGVDPSICDNFLGDTCQKCSGGASDSVNCGDDNVCVDGCCSGSTVPTTMTSFLSGAGGCPSGATACQRDFDCGSGNLCVQNCCINPQAITAECQGNTCATDGDCHTGNICQFGCCIGPCGINGTTCTQDPEPTMCGAQQVSCSASDSCVAGCCTLVINVP